MSIKQLERLEEFRATLPAKTGDELVSLRAEIYDAALLCEEHALYHTADFKWAQWEAIQNEVTKRRGTAPVS